MLFEGLSLDEEKNMRGCCTRRTFRTGDQIVAEGSSGNALYIIESGLVEIRKVLDNRHYKRIRELGPDDFFGEIRFLGIAHQRTAVVVAGKDCEVLQLSRQKLNKLLQEYPEIGSRFYANMAKSLAFRLVTNTEQLQDALLWGMEELSIKAANAKN